MTVSYSLDGHSYICVDRRYCVFLNSKSDRYVAISRETMERLAPWLSGWPVDPRRTASHELPPDLASVANDLLSQGLLTRSSTLGKPVRPDAISQPTESLLTSLNPPHFLSACRFSPAVAGSVLWARNRLTHHSLMSTIEAVIAHRRRCGGPSSTDWSRARTLVGVFNSCKVLFGRPNACLFDSLAILHFLARFKIFPYWVFGLIPEPFQAHCWLQDRTVVINDSVSHVIEYTPIMLV